MSVDNLAKASQIITSNLENEAFLVDLEAFPTIKMINLGRAVLGTSLHRLKAAKSRLPQLRQIFGLISNIDNPKRAASIAVVNSQSEPGITYGYLAERSRCVAEVMGERIDPSVQSIGKQTAALKSND